MKSNYISMQLPYHELSLSFRAQTGTMLLAIVLCTTVALTIANPFHKYPYVFLLDVGNEELQKTNTEQLRVSIPGGSLAMKYPVMGEGDTISHVRVSGIDFGTDLKVNIVDGGPGYKYVVLVFMGNPGVSYDAVVTLQTLPNGTEKEIVNTKYILNPKMKLNVNSYEVTDADVDDDDEEYKDTVNMKQYSKKNKEVMQASSTFYKYATDEMTGEGEKDEESENISAEEHNDDDDSKEHEDEGESSSEEVSESSNESEEEDDEDVSVRPFYHTQGGELYEADESIEERIHKGQTDDHFNDIPRAAQYTSNIDANSASTNNYKPADIVADSLYDRYQDLKPHFANGFRVYPQSFVLNKQYQVKSAYNKEDPVELEQMFNDEEVHNDARFKDGNNNIDSDYVVAEY